MHNADLRVVLQVPRCLACLSGNHTKALALGVLFLILDANGT
jgi:hypothetical protein